MNSEATCASKILPEAPNDSEFVEPGESSTSQRPRLYTTSSERLGSPAPYRFKDISEPFAAEVSGQISPEDRKQINREITRRSMQHGEVERLVDEHVNLVVKKFRHELTRKEDLRLALLRWQLDRLEDAQIGSDLDRLEELVRSHELFAKEIEQILDRLKIDVTERKSERRR